VPEPLQPLDIRVRRPRWAEARRRTWREWCFARSLLERLWLKFTVLAVVLAAGAVMFMRLEPERDHSFPAALFQTYSLIFGNPAESFPRHWALQSLFFLVPIVGLVVIIEGIVETATLVRDRRRNERVWCRIMAESMRDHVIIVGLGRLGYRTWQVLHQLQVRTVVLEVDDKNQFLADVRRQGTPLFLGDARRESLLVDANIADARAIVLATTDDLANLEIALDARKINPRIRVVLRMFDQNMADKVREGFQIPTAMSESAISAPAFATAALERGILSSMVLDHHLVVTAQGVVTPQGPLDGKSVSQVLAESGVQVIRILSGDSAAVLFPRSDAHLAGGDEIVFQGLHQNVRKMTGIHDLETSSATK
jgi:Trk K+ transport system NAD-binding subunit